MNSKLIDQSAPFRFTSFPSESIKRNLICLNVFPVTSVESYCKYVRSTMIDPKVTVTGIFLRIEHSPFIPIVLKLDKSSDAIYKWLYLNKFKKPVVIST